MKEKPILISGSHRSGTTFVGKILSFSSDLEYIHEPFNVEYAPYLKRVNPDLWYMYVNDDNSNDFKSKIEMILDFKFPLSINSFKNFHSKDILTILEYKYITCKNFLNHKRPLIKDPIALFSLPWLSKYFNMEIVILIRHPAAFASSIKHLKWSHNFNHFLMQPKLMSDYLQPFKEEIEDFCTYEHSYVEQAVLLWKIIYSTVYSYQNHYPNWTYLRHEDISDNPVEEFKSLFKKLDLDFTKKIESKIIKYTEQKSYSDPIYFNSSCLLRNSKVNKQYWKSRLTLEEINFVKAQVEEISSKFYSEHEW